MGGAFALIKRWQTHQKAVKQVPFVLLFEMWCFTHVMRLCTAYIVVTIFCREVPNKLSTGNKVCVQSPLPPLSFFRHIFESIHLTHGPRNQEKDNLCTLKGLCLGNLTSNMPSKKNNKNGAGLDAEMAAMNLMPPAPPTGNIKQKGKAIDVSAAGNDGKIRDSRLNSPSKAN